MCSKRINLKKKIREDIGTNLAGKQMFPIIYYEWNEEYENKAKKQVTEDTNTLADSVYQKSETDAHKYWDKFYRNHKLGFFHHRHYLYKEFQELNKVPEFN